MSTHAEQGFTLIEVLIAAVIVATCLLGLVGLQAAAMQHTHDTQARLLAHTLAGDMAARIQANPAPAAASSYGAVRPGGASHPGIDCVTSHCNPAQMAQYDAWEWQQSLAASLSHGRGEVQCTAHSGNGCASYIITVLWQGSHRHAAPAIRCNDRLDGINARTRCHTLEVRP